MHQISSSSQLAVSVGSSAATWQEARARTRRHSRAKAGSLNRESISAQQPSPRTSASSCQCIPPTSQAHSAEGCANPSLEASNAKQRPERESGVDTPYRDLTERQAHPIWHHRQNTNAKRQNCYPRCHIRGERHKCTPSARAESQACQGSRHLKAAHMDRNASSSPWPARLQLQARLLPSRWHSPSTPLQWQALGPPFFSAF